MLIVGLIFFSCLTFIYEYECGASVPSEVPLEYKILYSNLEKKLDEFSDENDILAWNGTLSSKYGSNVLTANAHRGKDLLKDTALTGAKLEIKRLKDMGVSAVTLSIGFPMFNKTYFKDDREKYIEFYKSVVEEIRNLNLTLVIESAAIFSEGGYSELDLSDFYRNLSYTEYVEGRLNTLLDIVTELSPDYLTVGCEPDTEEKQSGKQLNSPETYSEVVKYFSEEIKKRNQSVMVGAGIGTWENRYKEFVEAYCKNTSVDYIDMHIYPINLDFLQRADKIVNISRTYGKRSAMSEAWLYKASDIELAFLSDNKIFARDVFSFWSGLDIYFLKTLVAFSSMKNLEFMTPFWSKYFFAYIEYSKYKYRSDSALMSLSSADAAKNIQAGKYSKTGAAYAYMITNGSVKLDTENEEKCCNCTSIILFSAIFLASVSVLILFIRMRKKNKAKENEITKHNR
jgi:hypothetical protein